MKAALVGSAQGGKTRRMKITWKYGASTTLQQNPHPPERTLV